MSQIDQLIPLVMKLQDAFNVISSRNSIELPQIVVVGAQSTGKSSVLESIVGRDFLPRGSGIVTRCPLVLQLRRVEIKNEFQQQRKKESNLFYQEQQIPQSEFQEYAEFLHKKGEKFYDFDDVRNEINAQTNKLAGLNKNVCSDPISLTIYSNKLVDLTLVDLPGMTKVPVKGQPQDIEVQIRKLTYKFIEPQNALILALTAANTDLANSDALQLAREVDPDGERTIGVVTKIDLMDEGTDAIDLLQGNIYPLKLGYFGVKCRSQKQIDDKITIYQAIDKEKEFFGRHPIYSAYSDKLGIPYLSKSLNKILIYHIQKCIPILNKQITEHLQQKERELVQMQMEEVHLDEDKGPLILNLINSFLNTYGDKIEGRFVKEIAVECQGGSRINYIFHEIFNKVITSIDPFEYLTDQDIQTAIKNASALNPSLFVPEGAFEVLIRQQIARLLEPSLDCAHEVYEELRRLVIHIQIPELQRYYRLQSKICDVMESVLDKCLTPTTEMIANLIEIENAHINTNHPDFIGSADSILNLFSTDQDKFDGPDFDGQHKRQSQSHSLIKQRKSIYEKDKEASLIDDAQIISDNQSESENNLKKNKVQEQTNGYFGSIFGSVKNKQPKEESKESEKKGERRKSISSSTISVFTDAERKNEPMISKAESRRQEEEFAKRARQDNEGNELVNIKLSAVQQSDRYLFDNTTLPPVVLPQIPHKMRADSHQQSARVIMETRVIQNLIQSYFDLTKKNIADLVPKTIMAFLVNESRRIAQSELVERIYKQGNFDQLVVEDPMVKANRENCKKVIEALKIAQGLLGEVTQFKS